jgi:hypothetical protein
MDITGRIESGRRVSSFMAFFCYAVLLDDHDHLPDILEDLRDSLDIVDAVR